MLGYWVSLCEGFFFAFHENVAWTISPLPGKLSSLIYQGIIIPSLYSFAQAFMETRQQFKVHLIYTLSKRKSLSQENYVSLHVSKYSISIIQKWQAVSFPARVPAALGLAQFACIKHYQRSEAKAKTSWLQPPLPCIRQLGLSVLTYSSSNPKIRATIT